MPPFRWFCVLWWDLQKEDFDFDHQKINQGTDDANYDDNDKDDHYNNGYNDNNITYNDDNNAYNDDADNLNDYDADADADVDAAKIIICGSLWCSEIKPPLIGLNS